MIDRSLITTGAIGAILVAIAVDAASSGRPGPLRGFSVIPNSTITCPACRTAKTETMPTDACEYFYECTGCGELLRPKPGDCCVFCSYGSVPCPPIQAGETPTCRPI
jgi:hypothetical protein